MKRLSGWDAVLLYSETPTVHMHTLKLAVIDIVRAEGPSVRHRRVPSGHPQPALQAGPVPLPARRHPVQVPPPDVAGELRGRPRLPRAAVTGSTAPGGRRELDEADRRDRQHPAGPQQAAVGDVLHRGPGQRPDRGARQDPPRAGRRRRVGQPAGARDGPAGRARRPSGTPMQPIRRRPRASWCASAFADHMRQIGRLPGVMRYTAQGMQPGTQAARASCRPS